MCTQDRSNRLELIEEPKVSFVPFILNVYMMAGISESDKREYGR